MPTMAPEQFDACITDPPYAMPGTFYVSGDGSHKKRWTDTSIMEKWFELVVGEINRVLKPDATLIVFCNALSSAVFTKVLYERYGRVSNLVWNKEVIALGRPFRRQHELMVYSLKGAGATRESNSQGDVISHPKIPPGSRRHPAEKPVPVLQQLLQGCCSPGDAVLDPFAGSGSLGIAAEQLGRQATLIELDGTDVDNLKTNPCQGLLYGADGVD